MDEKTVPYPCTGLNNKKQTADIHGENEPKVHYATDLLRMQDMVSFL